VSFQQKTHVLVLAICYAGFLVLGFPTGLLGVAWLSIRADFAMPVEAQGALTTASALGYALVSAGIGRYAQRFGIRMMFVGMVALAALGFVGVTFSPFWLVLVIGNFIAGAGTGGLDAGLNLYAAAHLSPRVMNWLHATWGLGAALSTQLFTIALEQNLSWRVAYGLLLALYILFAVVIFFSRGWKSVDHLSSSQTSDSTQIAFRETLLLPIVWISVLLFTFYVATEIIPGNWAASLFIEGRGMDAQAAGSWASAYWAGLMAGRIFFGAIAHRLTPTTLLRITMFGAVVGIVGLAVGATSALSVMGLAFTSFCLGPIFPLLMSATPERLGEHAANTIGFQMAAVGLGSILLPAIAALLAGRAGYESVVLFTLALAVLMIALHEWLVNHSRAKEKAAAAA
jgi:fucose permease